MSEISRSLLKDKIKVSKEGENINLWINIEEWLYMKDWYDWKEIYFGYREDTLPLEHQFKQWRKKQRNR